MQTFNVQAAVFARPNQIANFVGVDTVVAETEDEALAQYKLRCLRRHEQPDEVVRARPVDLDPEVLLRLQKMNH